MARPFLGNPAEKFGRYRPFAGGAAPGIRLLNFGLRIHVCCHKSLPDKRIEIYRAIGGLARRSAYLQATGKDGRGEPVPHKKVFVHGGPTSPRRSGLPKVLSHPPCRLGPRDGGVSLDAPGVRGAPRPGPSARRRW